MHQNLTQRRQVLDHLVEHGELTSWDAITKYRITRVAEYVRQLRLEGKDVESAWETSPEGKRYVRYILKF